MERVIDKLFSGSFSVLVMFCINLCIFSSVCLFLVWKGKLETKYIETIFTALMVLMSTCWKDYLHEKKDEKIHLNGDAELKSDVSAELKS